MYILQFVHTSRSVLCFGSLLKIAVFSLKSMGGTPDNLAKDFLWDIR